MKPAIDQNNTFRAIEERIAKTTNTRHLAMLKRLLMHAKAEAAPDIDTVMSTLSKNPRYRTWANVPGMSPQGRAQVREFYLQNIVASGRYIFEFAIERIVVDDDTIVTEGVLHNIYLGAAIAAMGLPVDDAEAAYLFSIRTVIFWPFDDDGLIAGEESYTAMPQDFSRMLRKLETAEIPEKFRREYMSRTFSGG